MLVLAVLAASCTHDARRFAGPTRGPSFSRVASSSQAPLWTDADEFLVEYAGSTSRVTAAVASVGGAVARVLPLTYAVSLLEGILKGDRWSAHVDDVAALAAVFAVCTALSARVFRWE